MIKTNFVAYDVYRMDCTRLGYMMPSNASGANTSSPHVMNFFSDELYMEFGEAQQIEHNLPDEISSYDGMGVEIRLHVFCSLPSDAWANFYNKYLKIGLCDRKIDAANTISWNNRPSVNYHPNGKDVYGNWFSGYDDVTDANLYTGDGAAIEDVTVFSSLSYSPVEVLNALEQSAIALRVLNDPGGYSGYYAVNLYTNGTYKPYIEIVYGIVAPDADFLTNYSEPQSGSFINPQMPRQLIVSYQCGDTVKVVDGKEIVLYSFIGGGTPHKSTTVEFMNTDGVEIDRVQVNSLQVDVPDSVLALDNFLWRPTVENIFGAATTATEWKLATTVDSIPETVIASPKDTVVNVDKAAVFDWEHIIATGTKQTRFELQLLINDVWTTILEAETDETVAIVPAELLSSQATAWRVRTANNDGVYGEYSDPAKIILVVASPVTGVMVTGNVSPTVAWQAADQAGYEVMVDGVTMGTHYGAEKSYVWPYLLEDGQHSIKVRIINRYGLYSQWAEIIHHVTNVPQAIAPMLTAGLSGKADVQLMWSNAGGVETLVYRDGVLLDRAQSTGMYTDYTAYDEHSYRVRVVAQDSNYTDSNEVRVIVPLRETMLAAVGKWDWIELAYSATAEPPVRTAMIAPVYALNYYSGREKPVAEMSRHKSATYSVTYAVTEQQAAQLREMLGKIIVHKRKGELIRGLLQSVSETRAWWGVDVTLEITEVDES